MNIEYFTQLFNWIAHLKFLNYRELFRESDIKRADVDSSGQCIRTLRKALGDQARNSQFIETVPKHGYRFMAQLSTENKAIISTHLHPFNRIALLGGYGILGAGIAGVIGGTLVATLTLTHAELTQFGAASIMFVMIAITLLVALLGGAVGLSYALTRHTLPRRLVITSLCVGAVAASLIVAIGGNLLSGSLTANVPASHLPNFFLHNT